MTSLFDVGTALVAGAKSPHGIGPISFSSNSSTSRTSRARISSRLTSSSSSSQISSSISSCSVRASDDTVSTIAKASLVVDRLSSSSSSSGSASSSSSSCGEATSSISRKTKLHFANSDWANLSRPAGAGGAAAAAAGGGGGGVGESRRRRRKTMRVITAVSRQTEREGSGTSPCDIASSPSSSLASLSPSSTSAPVCTYHTSRNDVVARYATDNGVSIGLLSDAMVAERSFADNVTTPSSRVGGGGGGGVHLKDSSFTTTTTTTTSHATSTVGMDGEFVADSPSGPVLCNNRGCRPIFEDAYPSFDLDRGNEWRRRRDAAQQFHRRLSDYHARLDADQLHDRISGGGGGGGLIGSSMDQRGVTSEVGRYHHQSIRKSGGGEEGIYRLEPSESFCMNFAQFADEVAKEEGVAEKYYRMAVDSAPRDPKAWAAYANFAWRGLRDRIKAEQLFNRALEESPDCAEVLASYALFLWQLES